MKKILNTILVSLFLLIVTAGANFAALPTGTLSGSTYTLTADWTLNDNVTIDSTDWSNINTLNLGGYSIKGGQYNVTILQDLTIEGSGTITSSNTTRTLIIGERNTTSNPQVTLSNVTVNNTADANSSVIAVYGNSKLTLNNGTVVSAANNNGIKVEGNVNGTTPTLIVENATVTSGYSFGIFTNGNDQGTPTIELNDGASVSAQAFGIYLPAPNGIADVNSGSTVTGNSAIGLKGGELNVYGGTITGTGTYNEEAAPNSDGMDPDGSAIAIGLSEGDADGSAYGNAKLNIVGGTIKGTNAPAVNEQNYGLDHYNQEPLTAISITGGNFSSPKGIANINVWGYYNANDEEDKAEGFVSGGSFTEPLPNDYVDDNVIGFYNPTTGQFSYFDDNDQDAIAAYKKANPNAIQLRNGESVPTVYPASGTQSVLSVSFSNNALQYYQVYESDNQSQNIGFSLINVPSNAYFANALNWTITEVGEDTPYVTFESADPNWTAGSDEDGYYIQISNKGFTLKQYLVKGDTNVVSNGPAYLIYDGTTAEPGIYTLTATTEDTDPNVWNEKLVSKAPSATTRIIINEESDIDDVTITNLDGTNVTNPVTVDINTTRSIRFGYKAVDEDDDPVTGNIVTWNLTTTSGKLSDYAYINTKTGLITFYQPTAAGQYLILTVTVDGITSSNNVLIQVTGEEGELDGITFVQSPIFLVTAQNYINYDLASNVVGTPNDSYINPANLKFTSSNPNIIVYNSNTLVPLTPNYVGSTTITATYTVYDEDDPTEVAATYTTAYEITLVEKAVPATGITAEETLTFIYGITPGQNVNASLIPYGTTTIFNQEDATYESSDDNVATVSSTGEVQATGIGTATITTTYEVTLSNGTTKDVTAETTVYVYETAPVTAIELTPQDVVLSTTGDNTSQVITATLTPAEASELVTWTIEPETVATLVDNGDNTATVTAVADGEATVTATIGDVSATTKVTVTSSPVVVGSVEITSESPDYFTVTAYDVTSMVEGEEPEYLALFAWSNSNQSDINAKPMTHIDGTDNWVVENIPVNDTPINNYFDNADSITLNMYGSLTPDDNGKEIWNGTYKWVNDQNTQEDNLVAYIGYVQNIGFDKPTVFDGAEAGTTGQALQMEGLRISSLVDGVGIRTTVHVQDYGWIAPEDDGAYAGTMHENKQIEAVVLELYGDNADNYTIEYQVHVQDYGWMDPVQEGEVAGTTGNNLQIEAIRVVLAPIAD